MSSLKALMTNTYLRTVVKPQLAATPLDVGRIRALGERLLGSEPMTVPADVQHVAVAAQPSRKLCPAEWLRAEDYQRTVLYTHGGAYCFGNLDGHRPACAYLARKARAQVLSLDYRLAPEHPFPAALEDTLAWYRALLDSGTPASEITLVGDSAGGGLVLACMLAARDLKLPLPAGAVLFSPWVDLSCSGRTMRSLEHADAMLPPSLPPQAAALYLNGADAQEPLASPLFGDLHGLPPLMIHASNGEILLADATRLHDHAQAQGVKSELRLRTYLPHAWPVMLPLAEARETLRESAEFIVGLTPSAEDDE